MAMTLADLLARCGSLSQGQVVTVGVAIARELARLHAAGHVYAAVDADAIRIESDGRPTLSMATTGGGEPVDDLRALVRVLRDCTGPDAGLTLLRVLGTPSDAVTFARELYAVYPPEPLLAPADKRSPRRTWHRLRLVVVLAVGVVGAGLVGVASARSASHHSAVIAPVPTPLTPTGATTAAPAPLWRSIITELDATRDAAFVSGDLDALGRVYVTGARAWDIDAAALGVLIRHHARAAGLHLVVTSVQLVDTSGGKAVLRVVDRLPPYDVVDARGVVTQEHGRSARTWSITLQRLGEGWRILTVR